MDVTLTGNPIITVVALGIVILAVRSINHLHIMRRDWLAINGDIVATRSYEDSWEHDIRFIDNTGTERYFRAVDGGRPPGKRQATRVMVRVDPAYPDTPHLDRGDTYLRSMLALGIGLVLLAISLGVGPYIALHFYPLHHSAGLRSISIMLLVERTFYCQ